MNTREDQNGALHTYTYDNLGRLTLDTVTTPGTGVATGAGIVDSIGYTYDALGRPLTITSYDNNDGTTLRLAIGPGAFPLFDILTKGILDAIAPRAGKADLIVLAPGFTMLR